MTTDSCAIKCFYCYPPNHSLDNPLGVFCYFKNQEAQKAAQKSSSESTPLLSSEDEKPTLVFRKLITTPDPFFYGNQWTPDCLGRFVICLLNLLFGQKAPAFIENDEKLLLQVDGPTQIRIFHAFPRLPTRECDTNDSIITSKFYEILHFFPHAGKITISTSASEEFYSSLISRKSHPTKFWLQHEANL